MEFKELKEAIDQVELVDAHAHNIVSLESSFPFIGTFSEATGDALSFAPHSLSFKVYQVSHVMFVYRSITLPLALSLELLI